MNRTQYTIFDIKPIHHPTSHLLIQPSVPKHSFSQSSIPFCFQCHVKVNSLLNSFLFFFSTTEQRTQILHVYAIHVLLPEYSLRETHRELVLHDLYVKLHFSSSLPFSNSSGIISNIISSITKIGNGNIHTGACG